MEIIFADVVVDAHDAAFYQGEGTFGSVGMNVARAYSRVLWQTVSCPPAYSEPIP